MGQQFSTTKNSKVLPVDHFRNDLEIVELQGNFDTVNETYHIYDTTPKDETYA